MATGIEIAGLVLGAFPLAIAGIDAYNNGMKRVKSMKNYQQILIEFSRELMVEECKYDNTVLGLLKELVGKEKADRMKGDPTSAEWDNKDFQSKLKAQMGPAEKTLDNWLGVAEKLRGSLCAVRERFKLSLQEHENEVLPPPQVHIVYSIAAIYILRASLIMIQVLRQPPPGEAYSGIRNLIAA